MAEYNDVIKQFKRMCRYYNNRATQNDCPLYCKGHGCNISHCRLLAFDDKKFQNVVMAWAAEHPEPIYPTWREWLLANRIIVDADSDYAAGLLMRRKRIPADIAEKLGIEPKEGV